MQLNIHDHTLKRVGFINNDVPNALHYYEDNWHRYLVEGSSTFDFSVNKVNPVYGLITLESYISFTYENEDYLFNIVNIQQDHSKMQIQCENLNLELINEEVGAYRNTKRHSIVWYLSNAAKITDNILEIGNNPFSEVDEDTSNPILTFDSSETKLARIISICNSFKAEFKFKTNLKDDGTLQNITIDLYKAGGVGQVRKDVTLFYGKNVAGITSTGDKTSTFFNATTVTDSNNKYNWLDVEGEYTNSDGHVEFYKKAGENTAYAPLSRNRFPSQLRNTSADRYTRKDLSVEATSADSLWDYAVSQFKLYAYPQMTYEVNVSVNAVTDALGNDRLLDIGDTVTIQDSTFDQTEGGLILSARVSEQEISFTNPNNNKLTFSNFVKLKSDISSDLYGRMKSLVDQNTPYRSELETTNGTQFKNGTGSTILTARIYFGSDEKETVADSYEWSKDGTVVANDQTITVDASGVVDKAVYSFKATVGGKVVGSQSVTITNVNDGAPGTQGTPGKPGADGKTSYLHIAYATNSTGTAGFDVSNATGKTYIGQYTDFTSDDSTDPSNYTWSLIKGDKGDQGIQGLQGPAGSNGDPGKIISDAEPTAKFKGLTWKYSGITAINASDGTNIQPNTEYYWNGKNWVINLINAHNIKVDDLSAISATFTDGKIENNWVSGTIAGQTVIEDNHFLINSKDSSNKDLNTIALDNQQGFAMNYTNGSTGTLRGVYLNFQGLTFSDDSGKNYIAISSSGLNLSRDVPWTITGAFTVNPVTSNFNSSNYPGVSMYKYGNLVYMRFVTTNASATLANANIGSLPTGFIPSVQWHITLESKNGVTYRATVNPNGLITASMNIPASTDFRCTVTYPI